MLWLEFGADESDQVVKYNVADDSCFSHSIINHAFIKWCRYSKACKKNSKTRKKTRRWLSWPGKGATLEGAKMKFEPSKIVLMSLTSQEFFLFSRAANLMDNLRSSQELAFYLLIVQISRHNWPSFCCYSLQFAIFLYDSCHFLSQESSFLNLISQNVFLYRNWI